jgi:glycosyltransferase involved in cell wall biosynthesis
MKFISIVIPVYNSEAIIKELIDRLEFTTNKLKLFYQLILVDDGSLDNSWLIIENFTKRNNSIIGIKLSRNFGQHYAISAGLSHATGDLVVIMDCDLQDNPQEIENLYFKINEGWDYVLAKRINRKDNMWTILISKQFHYILSYLSGIKSDSKIGNFGIYKKKVIAEFNKMPEYSRSFRSLLSYLGFTYTTIEVEHNNRFMGKSTYTFTKLIDLAINIIISNSNKPLILTIKFGFIISMSSFLLALYNIYLFKIGDVKVPGFTTTVFSIWFIGGLILFVLGILGLYIDKIFTQVKNRQIFIIDKIIDNFNSIDEAV